MNGSERRVRELTKTPLGRYHREVRTTYILGAGASQDAGVPLTRDLFPQIANIIVEGSRERKYLDQVLAYCFPDYNRRLENYPYIEDFLSLLDEGVRFNQFVRTKDFSSDKLEGLRKQIVKAIAEVLWNHALLPATASLTKFAKVLTPGDVVISFNWDLLLDDHFKNGLRIRTWEDASQVALLKLHGSINWFKENHRRTLEEVAPGLYAFPYKKPPPWRHSADPLIVAPSLFKLFDHPALKEIWRRAYGTLSRSREIIFIGYSFPREDIFARFALRRAIRMARRNFKGDVSVKVVNHDRAVRVSAIDILGTEFTFEQCPFSRSSVLKV